MDRIENVRKRQIELGYLEEKGTGFEPWIVDYELLSEMAAELSTDETRFKEIRTLYKEFPKRVSDHIKLLFDCKLNYKFDMAKASLRLRVVNKMVIERSKRSRRADKVFRTDEEVKEAIKKGWFMIFSTYTFRLESDCKEFNDNKGFNKWKRAIDRDVMIACGLKTWKDRRGASPSDYHRYITVLEAGDKHGRLHLHALHFVKRLPNFCSDPNHGKNGTKQELVGWHRYWTLGLSKNLMIRTGNYDAYGRIGFGQVVKQVGECPRTGRPLYESVNCDGQVIGRYLSKYITQSLERTQFWRTKMNRGFGLTRVKKVIRKLTTENLTKGLILKLTIKLDGKKVPKTITRRLFTIEWCLRKNPKWLDLITLEQQESMLTRLLITTRLKQDLS